MMPEKYGLICLLKIKYFVIKFVTILATNFPGEICH